MALNHLEDRSEDQNHSEDQNYSEDQNHSEDLNHLEDQNFEKMSRQFYETYQVDEILGKGRYGSVYAGIRKNDGTPVALKYVISSANVTRCEIVSPLKLNSNLSSENTFKILGYLPAKGQEILKKNWGLFANAFELKHIFIFFTD